jgi:predicted MFS family arabinose efflux permease
VSVALVSTTFGAVAGPNLVTPTGRLAVALGLPQLAGPFLLAGVAYLLAGAALVVFLRPDPFLLARRLHAASAPATGPTGAVRRGPSSAVVVGAVVMVTGQIVMTAIMTMTPVHLAVHDHGLDAVGLVIGLHIAAMYLPSLLTGALVDRVGRTATAIASGVALVLAGVVAAASGGSLAASIAALVLLGLGWNLGLIAGTALIIDGTTDADRGRTQGTVDVLLAIAGTGGSASSGLVVAASGYGTLSLLGGLLALLLIPGVLVAARMRAARAV